METILLKLYKVTWKNTANSYVVCKEWDQAKAMEEIQKTEGRWDDVVGIEEVSLPAFDNDDNRKSDYVRLFLNLNIL